MPHEPQLLNAVAHLSGAIVFGIFVFLLLRDRRRSEDGDGRLPLASAVLALLWNAGSLLMLSPLMNRPRLSVGVVTVSFSALSLLPAVLLDLSLPYGFRAGVRAGYVASLAAIAMHGAEPWLPDLALHRAALLTITVGFAALTLAGAWRSSRNQHGRTSRIVASMGLLLFAISFAHFGPSHTLESWPTELFLHHAGIPVALFVLLQNHRFVLADALVHFLANVLLAALMAFGAMHLFWEISTPGERTQPTALFNLATVAGACALLMTFAFLRQLLQAWLSRVVFRLGDVEPAIRRVREHAARPPKETGLLDWAAQVVADFVGARRFELIEATAVDREWSEPAVVAGGPAIFDWVEAVVPIRTGQAAVSYLLLGRRHGGRRYLSGDLHGLGRLAAAVSEELERARATEMQRLVAQAELRALQSQINPHFLFNALNTIYGTIPKEATAARRTVSNLAEIFRYFLQGDKTFIALAEELRIVSAYLEIERQRLGTRLRIEMDVDESVLAAEIPILCLQPLVENAVKHGISKSLEPGCVRVSAKAVDGELRIAVEDTGPGAGGETPGAGIGLANVTRRLQLCYGPPAGVRIESLSPGTRASFAVPLERKIVMSRP